MVETERMMTVYLRDGTPMQAYPEVAERLGLLGGQVIEEAQLVQMQELNRIVMEKRRIQGIG